MAGQTHTRPFQRKLKNRDAELGSPFQRPANTGRVEKIDENGRRGDFVSSKRDMMEGKGEGKGGGEKRMGMGGKRKERDDGRDGEEGQGRWTDEVWSWVGFLGGKWKWEMELELELGGDRNSDARWASQAGAEVAEEVRSAAVGKKARTTLAPVQADRQVSYLCLSARILTNYSYY